MMLKQYKNIKKSKAMSMIYFLYEFVKIFDA